MTVGQLLDMPKDNLAKIVYDAIVHTRPMEGDPGHLAYHSRVMRMFSKEYECASDFATTSYNDLNLPDLHRSGILNYSEEECIDGSVPDARKRAQMVHDNPATVSFYFFLRQLLRKDVIARFSYPVKYPKWYNRYGRK